MGVASPGPTLHSAQRPAASLKNSLKMVLQHNACREMLLQLTFLITQEDGVLMFSREISSKLCQHSSTANSLPSSELHYVLFRKLQISTLGVLFLGCSFLALGIKVVAPYPIFFRVLFTFYYLIPHYSNLLTHNSLNFPHQINV